MEQEASSSPNICATMIDVEDVGGRVICVGRNSRFGSLSMHEESNFATAK